MTIKIGFIVAEFNRDITYQMEILGEEHAKFLGAAVIEKIYVPGVYDMPLAIKKMCENNNIDAVVTIGCVIEGDTNHDDVVVAQVTRKMTDLSIEYGKPVTLGISGPGMTRMQAMDRMDYAKRAVEAAVKLVQRV
jgi:6,7-dimethyl-8-ribityllumazine synthase